MRIDKFLKLLGVNIFAASDDHILESSCNSEVTLGSTKRKVARMEPTVLIDRISCSFGHLIIALHYVVSAGYEFAVGIVGKLFACFGVDNLTFDLGKRSSYGRHSYFNRIVCRAHRASGRCFGLSVNDRDLLHIHAVDNLIHYRLGTRRSCHNSGSHIGEVGLSKIIVLKHCYEHCRYAVERRYVFSVYARKCTLWREVRQRQASTAVCHCSGHCKHHSEAMEHRNLYHHSVCGRKIHSVADAFTVIYDVVVCEHNTLGKSCCTRGVLHIADTVYVDSVCHHTNLINRYALAGFDCFFPRICALHRKAYRDDIAQERKSL